MVRIRKTRIFGTALTPPMGRLFRRLGINTVINGFIRYTFVGEWIERFFRDKPITPTVGISVTHASIDFEALSDEMQPEL